MVLVMILILVCTSNAEHQSVSAGTGMLVQGGHSWAQLRVGSCWSSGYTSEFLTPNWAPIHVDEDDVDDDDDDDDCQVGTTNTETSMLSMDAFATSVILLPKISQHLEQNKKRSSRIGFRYTVAHSLTPLLPPWVPNMMQWWNTSFAN